MKNLTIPTVFGDYAVFPKGLPIRIYGEASAPGRVTLTVTENETRTADFIPENGKFSVTLTPVTHYAEDAILTVTAGDDTFTSRHNAIGVVLLAGGQSNMELMLSAVTRPLSLYPTKRMRFFTEKHAINEQKEIIDKPMSDVWYTANGVNELSFSAIGYFVAEKLSRLLSVTVGVVSCNQGAARIESFLSPEAQAKSGAGIDITFPDKGRYFNVDHWIYHNKYLHIAEFSYTAVLWYQGESNTGFAECGDYGKLLHALIEEWRAFNQNPNLPFYLVELASFDSVKAGWAPEPLGAWAPVREALVRASLTEEKVYTVSLTENENVAEIHPVNKYPLADKLVRAILTNEFGYSYEYTGPVLREAKKENGQLVLSFTHAEGLCFRGEPEDIYFEMKDGTRLSSAPTVENGILYVQIPADAVAFALAYHNVPMHNLYNGCGYLASPFRVVL